jgi:hypothetical protein
MTYRQTETSREIRLWLGQIVIPAIAIVATVMSNPEARTYVVTKGQKVKNAIKTKFKKSEA